MINDLFNGQEPFTSARFVFSQDRKELHRLVTEVQDAAATVAMSLAPNESKLRTDVVDIALKAFSKRERDETAQRCGFANSLFIRLKGAMQNCSGTQSSHVLIGRVHRHGSEESRLWPRIQCGRLVHHGFAGVQ
jgi:hypothetical protein